MSALGPLYGGWDGAINRRALLGGISVVMACPAVAAGGVSTLSWRGRATVVTGKGPLALIVETRVEPFVRARSRSWIVEKGEASARTLVIEPADGWLERDGKREPLPPALIAHERQQYGIYGYLLRALRAKQRDRTVLLEEPGFPHAIFFFEDGRPVRARYGVVSPDNMPPIGQLFAFSHFQPGAVAWPRHITIEQDGRPYFTLDIDSFAVTG